MGIRDLVENAELVQLATRYSFPPSVMLAVHTMAQDKSQNAMELVARKLNESFQQNRSWEAALSTIVAGDPKAHENPLNPAAGKVHAMLGIAAARPDWGMSGFKPVDVNRWAGHVKSMEKTSKTLAQLGGVVTPDHVQKWSHAITLVKYPHQTDPTPAPNAYVPPMAPPPQNLHRAKDVGEFAGKLKSMGATPAHFRQLFPHVASTHRRLLGKGRVDVEDFAPHVGQTPDQVLQSVRAMPSHKSPNHTAGEFDDAWHTAQLHSVHHLGRMPFVSEVGHFLSAKLNYAQMSDYYKRINDKKQGSETSVGSTDQQAALRVVNGGQGGD